MDAHTRLRPIPGHPFRTDELVIIRGGTPVVCETCGHVVSILGGRRAAPVLLKDSPSYDARGEIRRPAPDHQDLVRIEAVLRRPA